MVTASIASYRSQSLKKKPHYADSPNTVIRRRMHYPFSETVGSWGIFEWIGAALVVEGRRIRVHSNNTCTQQWNKLGWCISKYNLLGKS